jgi:hypothetical protein
LTLNKNLNNLIFKKNNNYLFNKIIKNNIIMNEEANKIKNSLINLYLKIKENISNKVIKF